MRRNPNYILKEVGEDYYLVPFGQAIEVCAPTIRVNDVAAFLWQEMERYPDEEALAGRVAEEYEVSPEDAVSLREDVRELLENLKSVRALMEDMPAAGSNGQKSGNGRKAGHAKESTERPSEAFFGEGKYETAICAKEEGAVLPSGEAPNHIVKIGGISLLFYGKEEYFSSNFKSFCEDDSFEEGQICGEEETAISVFVVEGEPPKTAELPQVLQGMTVSVDDGGDFYVMKSSETPMLREGRLWKDGSKAVLYVEPAENDNGKAASHAEPVENDNGKAASHTEPAGNDSGRLKSPVDTYSDKKQTLTTADCVFHAIRHVFLLRAQGLGMYVIHSASILHNGNAWLFSALSGTGKSTHTNIWHKLYGTPFLNGDLNLLAFDEGRPVVKGIPWCGTSGICTTEMYPLGGIFLLARNQNNYIEEMEPGAGVLGIQMRFISPKWNAKQAADSIDFARHIVEAAKVARLHCNMEDEAAEVCRAWIDGRGV